MPPTKKDNTPSKKPTPPYLDRVECSYQPLDFSFHPTRSNFLAAGLVDGSVELHDFEFPHENKPLIRGGFYSDVEDDDEHDTLVSSLALHAQMLPKEKSKAGKPIPLHLRIRNEEILNGTFHKKEPTSKAACKSVAFSADGTKIFSAGSCGDFVAVDSDRACTFTMQSSYQWKELWRIDGATEGDYNPITVIQPFEQNRSLIATGDDGGGIRIWDDRICQNWSPATSTSTSASLGDPSGKKSDKKHKKKKKKSSNNNNNPQPQRPSGCVRAWNEHDDYISAIQLSEDEHTLLATSADCRLGVYDLRMPGEVAKKSSKSGNKPTSSFRLSDDQEDELLSLQIMKNGKKAVCGTQEGVLSIFSWGTWGDVSDRFPGHPHSIDALLKVDEDTLLTGSSDGRIRVVQIQPDKLLGVIGDDHEGFPIEKLHFNSNRHLIGSLSHNNFIRLWDAKILMDDGSDQDDESDSDSEDDRKVAAKPAAKKQGAAQQGSDDEWDDMDDDGDDGDDSDDSDSDDSDSDEEPETVNDKRKKRLKTENEKFFEDLM